MNFSSMGHEFKIKSKYWIVGFWTNQVLLYKNVKITAAVIINKKSYWYSEDNAGFSCFLNQ
jgi:hypothetical protein